MLTQENITTLKQELMNLREQLSSRVEHDKQTVVRVSEREAVDELSAYDNHPADLGTELYEKERNMALDDHAQAEIEKIDTALHAMAEGSYGKCKVCGEEIPYERLEAVPSTLYCIDHTPERTPASDRPVEEDLLIPSFGDDFENRRSGDINDKEDSFGEVARFGTSETPADYTGDHENYDNLYKTEDESNGFTEDYEGFIGTDINGKNSRAFSTKQERQYEETLNNEGMESKLGDIPYRQRDSYLEDKTKKEK
ncbi:TraR/DksA C4-type zinc finger protein [Peribacillus sp. SCS-155]|uniref:TraR/DksA C4-type zinc finger protein n=1 Tax=Peribacillus sedimenti TaxID=3115297 RepID=UPI003905B417